MSVPPRSAEVLWKLKDRGWTPVLAHPERYWGLGQELAQVEEWRGAGVILQVNAGSFLGEYGSRARETAYRLLGRGWIHLVASDYHAQGTVPSTEARRVLQERRVPDSVLSLLFEANPARILDNADPEPAPPVDPHRRPFWRRLF